MRLRVFRALMERLHRKVDVFLDSASAKQLPKGGLGLLADGDTD